MSGLKYFRIDNDEKYFVITKNTETSEVMVSKLLENIQIPIQNPALLCTVLYSSFNSLVSELP